MRDVFGLRVSGVAKDTLKRFNVYFTLLTRHMILT